MARQLRIEYAGALYHVTSRGNSRNTIYADDMDREAFLRELHSTIKRYSWRCHAYCLMDNHYHLLIETPEGNLSRGMRQLNGVYTQRYNRRHDTVGHLFQGRFKSIIVEKESYLLQLCRYIVRNPVAAAITSEPADWPWSSYRATAGSTSAPDWLTVDWILGQFGKNISEAREHYRAFVAEGLPDGSPWAALVGRIFLGSEGFPDTLQPMLTGQQQILEIPKEQRYASRPALSDMLTVNLQARPEVDQTIYNAHAVFG